MLSTSTNSDSDNNSSSSVISHLIISCIRFYQLVISPLFPQTCRFTPSCSQYTIEALRTYGLLQGGLLGCRRLLRCHPWHPGGYDPVPKR